MDIIQDYLHLLPQYLPATLTGPALTLLTTTFGILKTLQTTLTPLLTKLTTQPDLASILLLIAILFLSFKILGMAYRAVMFWVTLLFRVVFWGAIAGVGLWIYQRGPDGFAEDVQGLAEHWSSEYHRFEGQVKNYQGQKEHQIKMDGYGARARRGWR